MKLISLARMSLLAASMVASEGCAVVGRDAVVGASLPVIHSNRADGGAVVNVDFQPIEEGRCDPPLIGWHVSREAAIRILKRRESDRAACDLRVMQSEFERDLANEIARDSMKRIGEADTPFRRYGFWIGLAVGVVVTGAGGIMIWQLLK